MTATIHLGFEVGTGKPVEIPLKHMAVTGMTQESGKTTTLEALVARLEPGTAALTFITKRGESAFQGGDANGVRYERQPYFRDRADWQFVDGLLAAQLQEKNRFLRPWIMKVCRTTRTLAEVHAKVKEALKTAKGVHEGVYTQLDAYLELIVPEIRRARLAGDLRIDPGLNVMDVSGFATPMQMLFVQSALDFINAHCAGTVVVIPEAWEFIPEGKGSPVKASAVALVRKGAAIGNLIWVDSQDMAGVDKTILRGCTVWLIGVQREANEIKRNLSNIPANVAKPSAKDVALLARGQFYACWGSHAIKTYVQPAWMDEDIARRLALGELDDRTFAKVMMPRTKAHPGAFLDYVEHTTNELLEGGQVNEKEARELREENERLTESNVRLQNDLADAQERILKLELRLDPKPKGETTRLQATRDATPPPGAIGAFDDDAFNALYVRLTDRLAKENPKLLRVMLTKQELEVELTRETITVDGKSVPGRVARLIAQGFFQGDGRTQSATRTELAKTGPDVNSGGLSKTMGKLVGDGFLRVEGGQYVEVPDMKVRIVENGHR